MEGVLVCADEHLQDTGIADAQNIIHYSVPENEFRTFLFRFSAMLEYYCEVSLAKLTKINLRLRWKRFNLLCFLGYREANGHIYDIH